MKVRTIDPGHVFQSNGKWKFSIVINHNHQIPSNEEFDSASAAKQAMRERIHFERKRDLCYV